MKRRQPQSLAPWTTIGFVVLATASMVYQWWLGDAAGNWLNRWGVVPARLFDGHGQLVAGEFRNLATALLVHVDWWHLMGNLVFLILFAPRVEKRLGSLPALGLMLFAGGLGNLWGAMQSPLSLSPIVGASGVVSALLGAFLVLFPGARIGVMLPLGLFLQVLRVPALLLIGGWFVLQLIYTWRQPGVEAIAWWTHIAGFISGAVLAAPARWYGSNR